MDAGAHLAAIRRDADAFAAAVRRGTGAPVPSCPGWTVADLARHMGTVHRWAADQVASRPDRGSSAVPDQPDDAGLADWITAGADALIATLAAADPADNCWTFAEDNRTVSFWMRRQANETSVHLWDAEAAHAGADGPPPVDAELAADGVDEYLGTMLRRLRSRGGAEAAGETYHFHRTDGPGEWFVVFPSAGGAIVTAEHAKADVAVRGSASDLVLWLWRRVPDGRVDAVGDISRLARWPELVVAA
ncbi:MAG: hypothetical protein JWO37_1043 [Acidimicrobiales bacterium]|jgi:uncharacterized protein (TIGR03083 family)|nr:hypothetical protein [Acidimicrobiales bacterium]